MRLWWGQQPTIQKLTGLKIHLHRADTQGLAVYKRERANIYWYVVVRGVEAVPAKGVQRRSVTIQPPGERPTEGKTTF